MKIEFDEGYAFGLGLFETIHIYKNKPLFLKEHIKRLNNSVDILNINASKISEDEVLKYLEKNTSLKENEVLKIVVSSLNKVFVKKEYPYKKEQYIKGFKVNLANTFRNETSIFTYHKTLNYAENIYEKRKSLNKGYDEPIFVNSKKELTEGATTNIFLVKDKKIFTPKIECGLLNGVVREWVIKKYNVVEKTILYENLKNYDEMFLTNSLLGIMPVSSFESLKFSSKEISSEILNDYKSYINL